MRRKGVPRLRALVPFGLVALVLAGCADKDTPQTIFHPEGSQSEKINNLQVPVFIIAGVVGVIVMVVVGIILWQFRAKKHPADEVPTQIHGNSKLEIAWTILPGVILLPIAVFTVATVFDLAQKPSDALVVDVVGQQWWWEFDYPDQGIVTANEMVIPVGRDVQVRISSRDVIHSFWIPALNGKRDAVPGRVSSITFQAEKAGEYWGQCTEFCGLSHANMRIRAIALEPDQFDAWVKNQQTPAVDPTDAAAKAGKDTFTGRGCSSCHAITGVSDPKDVPLVAGAAPNLTHLMSRTTFAGATYNLITSDCSVPPPGPTGTPKECLNRGDLEAWLRDPNALVPMAADQQRGMPNLHLTEAEIDNLVAYLSTLS
ncbi:MAG TPA: cytochrome c oxidase subunit II [Acidimicrobiales bacterium]|nr:cytochrome c oxidase subunit II [Acidimicrobiales bacterium]